MLDLHHLTLHCIPFKLDISSFDSVLQVRTLLLDAGLSFAYVYICGQPAIHIQNKQCRSNVFTKEALSSSLDSVYMALS